VPLLRRAPARVLSQGGDAVSDLRCVLSGGTRGVGAPAPDDDEPDMIVLRDEVRAALAEPKG